MYVHRYTYGSPQAKFYLSNVELTNIDYFLVSKTEKFGSQFRIKKEEENRIHSLKIGNSCLVNFLREKAKKNTNWKDTFADVERKKLLTFILTKLFITSIILIW